MNHRIASTRTLLVSIATATLLSACGGGDDNGAPAAGSGGTTVALAPFVISAATPAVYNGTYNKAGVAVESGSSNAAMSSFGASDDHCRVGIYVLKNGATDYFVEMSFRKDTKAVGRLNFGTGVATNVASASGAQAGVAVDTTNRRIGFTNVVLTTGAATVTLNGSLEYITNVDASNRAACG